MVQCMDEFKNYYKFDQSCQNKLKSYARVIDRLGQYKLKIALKKWF